MLENKKLDKAQATASQSYNLISALSVVDRTDSSVYFHIWSYRRLPNDIHHNTGDFRRYVGVDRGLK